MYFRSADFKPSDLLLNNQNVVLKMGQSRPLFVYFCIFLITMSTIQIEKAEMVCLGFEPAAAGW